MNQNLTNADNEIDLHDLFLIFWNRKFFIAAFTSIFAIFSIVYSLSLSNIYTSEAVLSPTSNENSLSSQFGNLSSLGSLAGVNLPSDSSSKSIEGIERIKSFDFFSTYFLPNINLENIMAVEEWDPQKNMLVYDDSKFIKNSNTWVRDVSYPHSTIPSAQEAFEVYKKIIAIDENTKTSFITISMSHESAIIAQKWVSIVVNQINESMRRNDQEQAKKSIDFLNEAANSTSIQSIKDIIAKLLEDQIKTLMLASSNEAYVFTTIDSPIVKEKKSGPSRALICILITFIGGLFSLILVTFHHFFITKLSK